MSEAVIYYGSIVVRKNEVKILFKDIPVKETNKSYKFLESRKMKSYIKKTEMRKVSTLLVNNISTSSPFISYYVFFDKKEDKEGMATMLKLTAKERIDTLLKGAESLRVDLNF